MKNGATRICQIVTSLHTFSRLDQAELKEANIHEGIDSTLMLLPKWTCLSSTQHTPGRREGCRHPRSVTCHTVLANSPVARVFPLSFLNLTCQLPHSIVRYRTAEDVYPRNMHSWIYGGPSKRAFPSPPGLEALGHGQNMQPQTCL